MPTALITGVTGQDGSYLAELLLSKGYQVVGMVRRTSTINFDRIRHIQNDIEIVQGDLLDQMSLVDLLREYKPAEVYNLAAQSFVPTSWKQPVLTGEFTALGVTRVLEAVRMVNPRIRSYQASSSEIAKQNVSPCGNAPFIQNFSSIKCAHNFDVRGRIFLPPPCVPVAIVVCTIECRKNQPQRSRQRATRV